jgi:hypothetical protein
MEVLMSYCKRVLTLSFKALDNVSSLRVYFEHDESASERLDQIANLIADFAQDIRDGDISPK